MKTKYLFSMLVMILITHQALGESSSLGIGTPTGLIGGPPGTMVVNNNTFTAAMGVSPPPGAQIGANFQALVQQASVMSTSNVAPGFGSEKGAMQMRPSTLNAPSIAAMTGTMASPGSMDRMPAGVPPAGMVGAPAGMVGAPAGMSPPSMGMGFTADSMPKQGTINMPMISAAALPPGAGISRMIGGAGSTAGATMTPPLPISAAAIIPPTMQAGTGTYATAVYTPPPGGALLPGGVYTPPTGAPPPPPCPVGMVCH